MPSRPGCGRPATRKALPRSAHTAHPKPALSIHPFVPSRPPHEKAPIAPDTSATMPHRLTTITKTPYIINTVCLGSAFFLRHRARWWVYAPFVPSPFIKLHSLALHRPGHGRAGHSSSCCNGAPPDTALLWSGGEKLAPKLGRDYWRGPLSPLAPPPYAAPAPRRFRH